jgi:hypothetical protein
VTSTPDRIDAWLDGLRAFAFDGHGGYVGRVSAGSAILEVWSDSTGDVSELLRAFPTASAADQVDIRLAVLDDLPPHLAASFPFRGGDVRARGRVTAPMRDDARVCLDLPTKDVTVWLGDERAGVWVRPREIPEWHWSSPFRQLLHSAAASRGTCLIHAATVGTRSGCVLIGGASFTGKSTASAMALEAGLRSGGDDYAEVDPASAPWPTAYPIYNILKIRHGNQVAPQPEGSVPRSLAEHAKDIHYLRDKSDYLLDGATPIRAVIAMTASHGGGLTRIPPGSAVLGLAPSTVIQSIYDEDATLRAITALCERVPTYSMPRPSDPEQLLDWLSPILLGDG